jgi:hypothetical protein
MSTRKYLSKYGLPMSERIQRAVEVDADGCWNWQQKLDGSGYGRVSTRTAGVLVRQQAHRASYEAFVGPIPEGMQIDHLCRNRACVNPEHLDPVTAEENIRRAIPYSPHAHSLLAASGVPITHCRRGHPFDEANTKVRPSGRRACRECIRQYKKDRRKSEKAEKASRVTTGEQYRERFSRFSLGADNLWPFVVGTIEAIVSDLHRSDAEKVSEVRNALVAADRVPAAADPTGLDYTRADTDTDDPTPVSPARVPLHTGGLVDGGELVDETDDDRACAHRGDGEDCECNGNDQPDETPDGRVTLIRCGCGPTHTPDCRFGQGV